MTLRNKLIRLASQKPELRSHLLPLLKKAEDRQAMRYPTLPRESYLPKELVGTKPNYDTKGLPLAVWTWEDDRGIYAIGFKGRAKKPLFYTRYRSESNRERDIQSYMDGVRENEERKRKNREEQKSWGHGISVGDIFYSSWGYDQTNIDYYEIVDVRGKQVIVREIETQTMGPDDGPQVKVTPAKGRYKGKAMRRKPRKGYKGQPSIKISDVQTAYPWDGKPKYQTGWAYGH